MTDQQRRDVKTRGGFFVKGSKGHHYFIRTDGGVTGNVYWVDWKGNPRGSLCGHPEDVPRSDSMLAQKLTLETDERAFLREAYVHASPAPPWRPRRG